MPVIDLLIPYWGDPEYTRQTIASIRAQTCPDWRLVVIDDAYPGTAIADHIAAIGDARIHYVRKDRNEGIIENFRSCVAAAEAPLMAMPGADDRLLPGYVAEIARLAEQFPDAAAFQPSVAVIDEDGHPIRTPVDIAKNRVFRPRGTGRRLLRGEELAVSLLHGDWLYWPSLAFRTESIQRVPFQDGLPVILDLALVLDMVFAGEAIAVSPETVFEYRRHRGSLSSTTALDGSRFEDERRYFRRAAAQARARGWRRAERAAAWHISSRGLAALSAPRALRSNGPSALGTLAQHVLRS